MIEIFRTLILLALIINSSACVSLDRMLNPISNHTHHYSFTNNDIVNGGILVAGFVASDSDDDSYVAHKDADAISDAINNERKEYKVSSAKSLKMVLSEEHYYQALAQYNAERWIAPAFMAEIRDKAPERYVLFARLEGISEYRSSNCYKRKKKKKKDEDGKETDEYEDTPDVYDVYRSSERSAIVSMDVFDLAQDIIVWSGTRDASSSNDQSYKTGSYVGEYDYQDICPYPDYPSWYITMKNSARGLAIHMPHKND